MEVLSESPDSPLPVDGYWTEGSDKQQNGYWSEGMVAPGDEWVLDGGLGYWSEGDEAALGTGRRRDEDRP